RKREPAVYWTRGERNIGQSPHGAAGLDARRATLTARDHRACTSASISRETLACVKRCGRRAKRGARRLEAAQFQGARAVGPLSPTARGGRRRPSVSFSFAEAHQRT